MRRLGLTALVMVAACSGGPSGSTLPPDPVTLLGTAAAAMGEVTTVRFEISRTGAPVAIDEDGLLVFDSAEGRFAAPAAADALIRVDALGIDAEVGAVSFDGSIWLTNPVTGRWEPVPATYAFDPATIFDPELGWRPLLAGELALPEVGEVVDFAGRLAYPVQGTAPAERIEVVTAGLVRDQDVALEMWLDAATGHVLEVRFATTTSAGISEWVLRFSDYGSAVEITPPDTAP